MKKQGHITIPSFIILHISLYTALLVVFCSMVYTVFSKRQCFSNNYNKYSVTKNKDGTYTVSMENPGRVPGPKAIYYKIIDKDGNAVRVYKDTLDPQGNLVHRKDK